MVMIMISAAALQMLAQHVVGLLILAADRADMYRQDMSR
jgi:hypothetical protein